ncbi:MAG TPA: Hsp20/alpha crystallin family protein [Streptosporangiaceae bacterium]|nr:Hsp20/alpha crystallin family protein [Streptosporangiaceae bacterium]
MLLTSFDPFVRDFDRIVQRSFGWADGVGGRSAVLPMDVIRREAEVVLRIDLPGADQGSVDVTTDQGVLTVSAKRSEEYGEQERPVVRERLMGSYTRRIRLAETVDTEKIEAAYDNGVLTIVLPLQEKAKARKVEIKGAAAPELTA